MTNPAPSNAFPCPCCGYRVFAEPPGSYDICPVCGWEDDDLQLRLPLAGGANAPLLDCQRKFLRGFTPEDERSASEQWARCSDWRPLTPEDLIERQEGPNTGHAYLDAAVTDPPEYYWRKPGQDLHRQNTPE